MLQQHNASNYRNLESQKFLFMFISNRTGGKWHHNDSNCHLVVGDRLACVSISDAADLLGDLEQKKTSSVQQFCMVSPLMIQKKIYLSSKMVSFVHADKKATHINIPNNCVAKNISKQKVHEHFRRINYKQQMITSGFTAISEEQNLKYSGYWITSPADGSPIHFW